MRKIMIVLAAVVSVSLAGFLVVSIISPTGSRTHLNASEIETSTTTTPGSIDDTYIPPATDSEEKDNKDSADNITKTPFVPATEIDTDITSITVFINKEYALPKDYVPEDMVIPNVLFNLKYHDERKLMRPEAAAALEDLFDAAKADGYTLYGISAYRSYDRQRKIFINNIVKKGKNHTLKYSAVPGTSEHQSGLAIDVSTKSLGFKLIEAFADSPEGIWLANNAHRFGYIIRYPKDKLEITGYAYEPWHIRYVGKDLANYLYTNDLTLDEYYQYTPSEGFDFEAKYAYLINYRPPIVTAPPLDDDPALSDEEALLDGETVDDEELEDDEASDEKELIDNDEVLPEDEIEEEPEDPNSDKEEEDLEGTLEEPDIEDENPVEDENEDPVDADEDEDEDENNNIPDDVTITPTGIPINEDANNHTDSSQTSQEQMQDKNNGELQDSDTKALPPHITPTYP
ncbi:MAG: M15 family metallopeptidase [Clostridiales bacterium]|nr:M15 family metallopeptidase [Clostridiales bacterium]